MLYYRHTASLEHDPRAGLSSHPDTPERIRAVEAALARESWLGAEVRKAPEAGERELTLVHTPEHVAHVRGLCEAGGGQIDADTYVSEASYQAALHAAGGACAMVTALLNGEDDAGFSALRPAGHHAERERAMGFCLFNNVSIAAELAIRDHELQRVAIIDWDVHHGNGTAEIFRRRRDVLFASIHQAGLYPGTGAAGDAGSEDGLGFTINAPVPSGSGPEVWLSVLEHVIVPAVLEFAPQLILISAGFDAHHDDPLGGCALDEDAFAQLACHVRDAGRRLGTPVGAVLEGGYDPPALARCVLATVAALGGEGEAESIAPDPAVTPRVAARVAHYWQL